jgi:hypothetical protein
LFIVFKITDFYNRTRMTQNQKFVGEKNSESVYICLKIYNYQLAVEILCGSMECSRLWRPKGSSSIPAGVTLFVTFFSFFSKSITNQIMNSPLHRHTKSRLLYLFCYSKLKNSLIFAFYALCGSTVTLTFEIFEMYNEYTIY